MNKWESNFHLGETLTQDQLDFFEKNGVIVFRNFLSSEKISSYLQEIKRLEAKWLAEKQDKINGIPLKFGKDEQGNKTIQRLCFTSQYSEALHELLSDPRLIQLPRFLGEYDGRIAENEKDGLVVNNYLNIPNSSFSQMGWHTDSPRDLFLGQKIMPMLNVGIHLDKCLFENGGLRVLPGTHKQNVLKLLFGKKYFIDHRDDKNEVGFDLFPGDLSVHDGRLWHRVKQSPLVGEESRRRVMYVPIVTGKYKPKGVTSKTPFYHLFTSKVHK